MKYTAISFNDVKVKTWSCPQFIPGVGEEAIFNYKQSLDRAMRLGRIQPENVGLDCYIVGTFDDDEGSFVSCKPEFLVRLENLA